MYLGPKFDFNAYAERVRQNCDACARILGPLSNSDQNAIALMVASQTRKGRQALLAAAKTLDASERVNKALAGYLADLDARGVK